MSGFSKISHRFHNVNVACFDHKYAKSCAKHMLKLDSHGKLVRRVAERCAHLGKKEKHADDDKIVSLMKAISHLKHDIKRHDKKEYSRIKHACDKFEKAKMKIDNYKEERWGKSAPENPRTR